MHLILYDQGENSTTCITIMYMRDEFQGFFLPTSNVTIDDAVH